MELVYNIKDRPSLGKVFLFAVQQLLALVGLHFAGHLHNVKNLLFGEVAYRNQTLVHMQILFIDSKKDASWVRRTFTSRLQPLS